MSFLEVDARLSVGPGPLRFKGREFASVGRRLHQMIHLSREAAASSNTLLEVQEKSAAAAETHVKDQGKGKSDSTSEESVQKPPPWWLKDLPWWMPPPPGWFQQHGERYERDRERREGENDRYTIMKMMYCACSIVNNCQSREGNYNLERDRERGEKARKTRV